MKARFNLGNSSVTDNFPGIESISQVFADGIFARNNPGVEITAINTFQLIEYLISRVKNDECTS